MKTPVFSIVINAHHPYVECRSRYTREGRPGEAEAAERLCTGECPFFEALSGTYLPLLALVNRLEQGKVQFKLGVALSPVFCELLEDRDLMAGYLGYLDKKIEFGCRELERTRGTPGEALARHYYDEDVERRIFFTEHCEMDLPAVFSRLQQQGCLELLTTAASYAFLPFFTGSPEVIHAQIETALISHRRLFGRPSEGFWLPEFGWSAALEPYLRSYNLNYTLVDSHSLVLGSPPAEKGVFYPVKTPGGLTILGRDYLANSDLVSILVTEPEPVYQEHFQDVGYELPAGQLEPFIGLGGERRPTGYRYSQGQKYWYDPAKARELAVDHARAFLDMRLARLEEAARYLEGAPISLWACNADILGVSWYEGPVFLEALIREAAARGTPVCGPLDYIGSQNRRSFQVSVPEYSSWLSNGYAETWLDASNDWMYRHIFRSIERMIEMAERFPNDSGLKERALNQAVRELLLAQGADWPRMLGASMNADYAKGQIEGALRNFTTIYESLGSNYISTEWLTALERQHRLFPQVNYRVFARKK